MIYIAAHKKFNVPQLDNYAVLQVGAQGKENLGYLQDNTGDNISYKNPNFCELTGLYWIWKNCDDEYKGLVHYRRYFGKSNLSSKPEDIYTYQKMLQLLDGRDIVLPYVECFKMNAREEILSQCCTEEIFEQLEMVIDKLYPEYRADFDKFFAGNKAVLFNMMFCKAEVFDAYCKWLFDVLFELEKSVDLSELNAYQQRLYGFLSERLLNVWIMHNKLNVVNTPVINVEMSEFNKVRLIRRRITNRIRYAIFAGGR